MIQKSSANFGETEKTDADFQYCTLLAHWTITQTHPLIKFQILNKKKLLPSSCLLLSISMENTGRVLRYTFKYLR